MYLLTTLGRRLLCLSPRDIHVESNVPPQAKSDYLNTLIPIQSQDLVFKRPLGNPTNATDQVPATLRRYSEISQGMPSSAGKGFAQDIVFLVIQGKMLDIICGRIQGE